MDGSTIQMSDQEVIEDGRNFDEQVPLTAVCGKCQIVNIPENESVSTALKKHKSSENEKMYVCRYKLVKQTSYMLLPVRWTKQDDQKTTSKTEKKNKTKSASRQKEIGNDVDEQDPNDPLADHHFELVDQSNQVSDDERHRLVSPIKIVNNSVQKVNRAKDHRRSARKDIISDQRDRESVQNDESNDEECSPSKRSKRDEMNANYLTESPVEPIRQVTQIQRKSTVRKNLNTSFKDVSLIEEDSGAEELEVGHTYNIVERKSEEKGMRITFKKTDTSR